MLAMVTLPCGVLNVGGFYDPLLALFDRAVEDRFIRAEHRGLVLADTNIDALLEKLASFKPVKVHKLIDRAPAARPGPYRGAGCRYQGSWIVPLQAPG